jgi:hypothetical protein
VQADGGKQDRPTVRQSIHDSPFSDVRSDNGVLVLVVFGFSSDLISSIGRFWEVRRYST